LKEIFLGTRKFLGVQKKFGGALPPNAPPPWLRAWAYGIDSGNRIRFNRSEYDKLQLTEMWRNRSEGMSA